MGTPNWEELTPDILRCVFERLSFASLRRAKLVCRSWYSASKGCVPNQNQIPWLILFPPKEKKENRCMMYVPEDNKLYSSRYLGVEFAESDFLRSSCGSWILMLNAATNLYIVNPFTGERFDLPVLFRITHPHIVFNDKPCFWIDKETKDYLVVLPLYKKFTKKGLNEWQEIDTKWCEDVFYNHRKQKLYVHFFDAEDNNGLVDIWDFSSGDMPHLDESVSLPWFHFHPPNYPIDLPISMYERQIKSRIVVTVSGDILIVSCIPYNWKPWYFLIFKRDEVNNKWVETKDLGDEALIYDMGITVTADDSIPGIDKNSIYFSSRMDFYPFDVFIYDINTCSQELLPQHIASSIPVFATASWFFPY